MSFGQAEQQQQRLLISERRRSRSAFGSSAAVVATMTPNTMWALVATILVFVMTTSAVRSSPIAVAGALFEEPFDVFQTNDARFHHQPPQQSLQLQQLDEQQPLPGAVVKRRLGFRVPNLLRVRENQKPINIGRNVYYLARPRRTMDDAAAAETMAFVGDKQTHPNENDVFVGKEKRRQ